MNFWFFICISLLMASFTRCNTSCMGNSSSGETEPESDEVSLLPSSLVVLLCIIGLLIIVVNGLVIFLMHKKKTLRTLTNMFLTSLALSDLVSGLVGIPLLLICIVGDIVNVCVSSTIFIRFTAISSVCHVLVIACDRYIFIIHSFNYHFLVTKRRVIVGIFAIWLLSFAASVIQLSWQYINDAALTEIEETTEAIDIKYSLACIVVFFAVPLLSMCYIYGRIFYISYQSNKRDRKLSKNLQQPVRSTLHEWRGRSVLLIAMVIFAGCWLPFFLMILDAHMETSPFSPIPLWINRLLVFLGFIPPLLNPVLCTLAKKDFRHALTEAVFRRRALYEGGQNVHFQVARNRLNSNHNVEME